MQRVLLVLTLGFAAVAAAPRHQQRIIGGNITTIDKYPYAASLLYTIDDVVYNHFCGGTILNSRSILTAGHCISGDLPRKWRMRIGSTHSNSGGQVHETALLIVHPLFNEDTNENDIAIMRPLINFDLGGVAKPASLAGANYQLRDQEVVWAVGWGITSNDEQFLSEQLREVQVWSVNQSICVNNYGELGRNVTQEMLCTGWMDVGGRDQCTGDSGGPLLHHNVVVGVCSWGYPECGHPKYPGVNIRISSYIFWIQLNA